MPLVERRYAEALIDISVKNSNIDAYQREFEALVTILEEQQELKLFLSNPEVKLDTKKDAIRKIFTGRLMPEMVNFLMVLLDKGRIALLPGIYKEYVAIADSLKNIIDVTIISAIPLSEGQVKAISEKYRLSYNAKYAKVNVEIDESLIGGLKVKVGDKVTDASIKGRLEALKELIVES